MRVCCKACYCCANILPNYSNFCFDCRKLRKQLIEDDGVSENFMTIYFDKTGGVEAKCDKPAYQYPCRPEQVNSKAKACIFVLRFNLCSDVLLNSEVYAFSGAPIKGLCVSHIAIKI